MQGTENYEKNVQSNGFQEIANEKNVQSCGFQEMALSLELDLKASQSPLSLQDIRFLEKKLDDIYLELKPIQKDYEAREAALNFVDKMVRNKLSVGNVYRQYGFCYARAFGSFAMDMFTADSDLDISLNVEFGYTNFNRNDSVQLLKKLARLLYGFQSYGAVKDLQPIMRAKVPVVKFVHCDTGIECDISAENRDGIIKTKFLSIFSCIDPRFHKLCLLVKAWANKNAINSSKDHTLNSLSFVLLVAFHLQTRIPAILPPFSAVLEGNDLMTSEGMSIVHDQVHCLKGYGRENKDTVAELFSSFLIQMLAVKDLWKQGLCASPYQGRWCEASEPGLIYVEDFTILSQNTARAVTADGFNLIYHYLHEAHSQIRRYADGASTCLRQMFTPSKDARSGKKRPLNETREEPRKKHARQADGPAHDVNDELATLDPENNTTIR